MSMIRNAIKSTLSNLRTKPIKLPLATSPLLQNERVDEESIPTYNSRRYYPVKPGEILGKYQIISKVGWGTASTTWLAHDLTRFEWQSKRFVTLKVGNSHSRSCKDERDLGEHIANAKRDPSHLGLDVIRTPLESFEMVRPEGGEKNQYLCLVFEPMREPMWIFQRRFVGGNIPLLATKMQILVVLAGLDFLHSCKVVHTDLKLENILVAFEDQSVINDYVELQTEVPMNCKIDSAGRTVYRCHNDFGDLRHVKNTMPRIIDLGSADRLDDPGELGSLPIQPNHYRAPEVLLNCGWSFSADKWSLGTLVWDFIERTELFENIHDAQRNYSPKGHIAEMIALLGSPPPKKLLDRADKMRKLTWGSPDRDPEGRLVNNSEQYFGGPFFKDGEFLYNDLIPSRRLEDTLPSLNEKDKEHCLDFVRGMLTWLPEERKTARELMEHPFHDVTR